MVLFSSGSWRDVVPPRQEQRVRGQSTSYTSITRCKWRCAQLCLSSIRFHQKMNGILSIAVFVCNGEWCLEMGNVQWERVESNLVRASFAWIKACLLEGGFTLTSDVVAAVAVMPMFCTYRTPCSRTESALKESPTRPPSNRTSKPVFLPCRGELLSKNDHPCRFHQHASVLTPTGLWYRSFHSSKALTSVRFRSFGRKYFKAIPAVD